MVVRADPDRWLATLRGTDTAERSIEQAIGSLRAMLGEGCRMGSDPREPTAGLQLPHRRGTPHPTRAGRKLAAEQLEALPARLAPLRSEWYIVAVRCITSSEKGPMQESHQEAKAPRPLEIACDDQVTA